MLIRVLFAVSHVLVEIGQNSTNMTVFAMPILLHSLCNVIWIILPIFCNPRSLCDLNANC